MEGDAVEDPASVFQGQRMKSGWKNSGCPWTYDLTPERMLLPKVGSRSCCDTLCAKRNDAIESDLSLIMGVFRLSSG